MSASTSTWSSPTIAASSGVSGEGTPQYVAGKLDLAVGDREGRDDAQHVLAGPAREHEQALVEAGLLHRCSQLGRCQLDADHQPDAAHLEYTRASLRQPA